MGTNSKEIEDALETVDAAIFTGDELNDTEKRDMIREYAQKWLRAIDDHVTRPKLEVGDKMTVVARRTESMGHK